MIKRFYVLLLAIVASVGMSLNAAGIPCTAADLGKVLCTDGSIYATVSDATAASKTAVAMIAYIDTENNKGLALALVEESGNANWSQAIATCAAKTPTVTGGTWKLASEDEWSKIIDAAGGRNALRDGFSAIGGSNLKSGGNDKYWSSTESSNTEKGRCISFDNIFGGWSDASKTTNYPFYARACLAFNIGDPAPAAPAELPGAFTINANGDKIVFSRGNLQATTTDFGANWTWDFAPNQWSLIGDAVANNAINGNKSVSANGTVDLFGWSTAATYYGIHYSKDNATYSGDFVDWGNAMTGEWRTLSRAEFRYIVFDRAQAFYKQGKATVNGVKGYIFLPDKWTLPSGLSFTPSPSDYTTNQYDGADWDAMENAGAVFLPAAGDRVGSDIYMYDYGWYWTSTSTVDDKAYYLYFYKTGRDFVEHNRYDAKSVRLVTAAPAPAYETVMNLINEIPNPLVRTAACMAAVETARAAYDALSSEDQALVTNYATLESAETYFDPQMVWNNLPAGGVVGTIGHEDEISLPLLNGSADFYDALYNLQISVTLRSTNENILKVSGFNNFKVYAPGECDVYAVHYATDGKFAYDSVAFHVTINPATPTPVSVVLPTVKYAVCNVPDGWTVTANGDAVLPINGRYHIVDGQTVVLTPSILTNEYVVTSEEPALVGAGTAEDPYLIYTVANWNAVAAKVNDGTQPAAHCIQMANLDGVTTVMGNSEAHPFKGIYDGNGFIFSNINLSITSGSNPLGLFGCVNDASAVVKNVVVAGGTVFSTIQNVGTIVGQLNGGTVQYCANYATIASTYNGKVRMGGIVGWMRSAGGDNNRVDHCINYGNLSGKGYVGGITGSCGAGYVSYCQNYGSISSAGTDDATKGSAGGIIGWHNPTDATKITYNHNGGNIIEAAASGYGGGRYVIGNGDPFNTPASNSYLSWLTLTIGSTNYTGAELATHEPSAQAVTGNPEGISISGITYAYNTVAPIAPAPGTNPGTDPAQQSNKTWQFTMPSHNVGLTVTIVPTEVIALINELPNPMTEADLKLSVYDKVTDARAAYDALTADQKLLVSNYSHLTDAEAAFDGLTGGGTGVEGLLTTITVSNSVVNHSVENIVDINQDAAVLGENGWTSGMVVVSAKPGFTITKVESFQSDGMWGVVDEDTSSPFEISITSGMTLTKLNVYGYEALSPIAAAQAAVVLINAIPSPVTLDSKDAIDAARAAVDALGENAKLIDDADMAKLNQAIADYTALIQAGADAVTAKIAAIPQPVTLKLATRDSIESARAAYDALNADQKLLVTNYQTLLDAEATWAGLVNVAPAGALSGKYTINVGGDVIYFAHGNLQYTRENLDADWSTGTFRLAENQYDMIEEKASPYCTDNYGDKTAVGLFGWGTWGEGKTPNLTSSDRTLYTWSTDFSGTLEGTDTWRTLTKDEWVYLLANHNMTYATVHGVNGLLVAPDGKDIEGKSMADWVVINDETWTTMQNDGYLFLPACGQRSQLNSTANIITGGQGTEILYYSSTQYSDVYAHNIWYKPGQDPAADDYSNKRQAFGIRLVSAGVNPLDQVQVVKGLIDAIPDEITLDAACMNAIQSARAAYDALDTDAKAILDAADVKKLTDAEQALKDLIQAGADAVKAKIAAIPQPVELKLATRDSIQNARTAYDALNAAQQALVTNYQTLLDAEAALAELNKGGSTPVDIVWDGNTGIANVSPTTTSPAYEGMTVTVGAGSSFSTYQSRLYFTFYSQPNGGFIFANENGTNITKVVIESTTALTSTMTEVDRMGSGWVISNENKTATWTGNADSVSIWKGQSFTNYWVVDTITFTVNGVGATPLDSAQAAKDLIDAIPDSIVYPTSGPAIEAALVAYNQLSDAAKGALDAADVQKLTDAVAAYKALADKDAAETAIARIDAIPSPVVYSAECKEAIDEARAAYDALSDEAKALVSADELKKLTDAEAAYAALAAEIEFNVEFLGKEQSVLYKDTIALTKLPNGAPEENGWAFDHWEVLSTPMYAGLHLQAVYRYLITLNPQAYDTLVYNGIAQTLITAGEAEVGHLEYRIGETEWSAELPKATSAGTYAVQYKLVQAGKPDYIAPNPVMATIAKAPVAYTAPVAYDTLVYTAAAQTLVIAGQTNDGTFEYTLTPTDKNSWKVELPQYMVADTIDVYFRVIGDDNHLDSTAVIPVQAMIVKAPLNATADDKTVIYGDPVPMYTVTYTGWQGEDTLNVLKGDIAFACEYMDTVSVGEYTIFPYGQTADNYAINFVPGKLTVNKAQSECVAPAAFDTLVYNGGLQTLILPAQPLGGEMYYTLDTASLESWSTELPQAKDADTYSVFYRVKGDKNHLDQDYENPVAVKIAQAKLIVTPKNKEVIYGDSIPEYDALYNGFMGIDTDSVISGLTYTCAYEPTSPVGNYAISLSGATAKNYNISYNEGKVVVQKATLTITADDKNVIYGDSVPTYTASFSGWKNNDGTEVLSDLTFFCAYQPTSNVGTYAIHADSTKATNYSFEYIDGKVTVAKADLTITALDTTVIYGDPIPQYLIDYQGWKNTDDPSVVDSMVITCAYAQTSDVGTYPIELSGAKATNYAITLVSGKVTVNKAALSITAEDKTLTYGDSIPAYTVTYQGWKNNDSTEVISGLLVTCPYAPTSNVGEYVITPSGATAINYAITFNNGKATVNQADLTITADKKVVTYGDAAPTYTASYSGWKNADDASVVSGLKLTCPYAPTSNVGEYVITPSGATALNYAITFVDDTLTVNKAALMITAKDKSVIYADPIPVYDALYEGWKNADDSTVLSGLTFICEYEPTSNVGTYTITPDSAKAMNYAISYTTGTVTVSKAALTITANDTAMIYGDEHPEFTASYEGWKNSDDASVVSGLAYTTPYIPGSPIGTYTINPNSATATNYAITFVDGTLTVNKAVVKVAGAEAQIAKFEDGTKDAVVLNAGTLNGIKLSDPIAHNTTAEFNDPTIAEHKTITLFYELTGDAALLANYDLIPTSDIFTTEGVIIENFIPDTTHMPEEDEQVEVQEGISVYAYGYCEGDQVGLKYHLNSGNPDQYKIDFADSRFVNVPWTNLEITGKDGIVYIDIPVDVPTGDYQMTVYFRDSRFTWLESQKLDVTFHVNLPETYVVVLFDNTIALVDTCNCFTDIQWYWRANSADTWKPIEGATGHYYHADGKLTGEYFVSAKMNGVPTYTCGQNDMETLYGSDVQQAQVSAYPNPVITTTTVTIENSANYEHSLRIVSLMGVEMMHTTFEGNETIVDMNGYTTGNYMISVDGIVVKVMKK